METVVKMAGGDCRRDHDANAGVRIMRKDGGWRLS